MSETTMKWLERVVNWKKAGVTKEVADKMLEAAGYVSFKGKEVESATTDYHQFQAAWKVVLLN